MIAVPTSLELLDVASNGMACERFIWIRGLSDPSLAPKQRMDLIDDTRRVPGELLHIASTDGTTAATTFTVTDHTGAGSCSLTIHARTDPGEPILGDLVELAADRARVAGAAQVRCGDAVGRPHIAALLERHGFVEHERWRRFHVDVATAPEATRLPGGQLPDEVRVATLAGRPGRADTAFRMYREGLADMPGDAPHPHETAASWLAEMDSSPVLGRDLVLLLLDDADQVLALAKLERLSFSSEDACVGLLTVDRDHRGRGLARLAMQCTVAHAAQTRIRRLQTVTHADDVAVCGLNEQLGWSEDPVRVSLRLDV